VTALRQDLTLLPVEADKDGTPAWTLHDPAQNRFFRFGPVEIELLSMPLTGAPAEIAARAAARLGRPVAAADVAAFQAFLHRNNLLEASGDADRARLLQARAALKPMWLIWLVRNYLSLRLPLVRPDDFLARTVGYLRWWFAPQVKYAMFALGAVALLLVVQRWDEFLATAVDFLTPRGLVAYAAALIVIKILHELGHAYTAKHHGARVPAMGVAFVIFWPLLYTDTTDAWRLSRRRARVEIDVAGMKAELAVAILALLLWSLLPDGRLRGLCFLASTTSLLLTFTINLNPLMRFDGYYLLSDWLGIENLQERAAALARWRWREFLFALGEPPPEPRSAGMVAYAVAGWIYRTGLTFTIAFFIYTFFFKLLGLLLMTMQLWFYVLRPAWREIASLRTFLPRVLRSGRSWVTFAVLAGLVALLAMPFSRDVSLPAYLQARQSADLYAPLAGQAAGLRLRNGAAVAGGDALLTVASPDMAFERAQLDSAIRMLRWQLEIQGLAPPWLRRSGVIEADLRASLERQRSLQRQDERSRIVAPFDGVLRDVVRDLHDGQWVAEGEYLGRVVAPGDWEGVAFMTEAEAERVRAESRGRFVAADGSHGERAVAVDRIDPVAVHEFDRPYLLSLHGGPLLAKAGPGNVPVPMATYYRIRLSVDESDTDDFPRVLTGHVVLPGQERSVFSDAFTAILRILRREVAA